MLVSLANTPIPTEQDLADAQQRYIAKTGRPSSFTPEIATEIINRLASGETLRSICKDKHMPCNVTVYDWANNMPAFSSAIAHARRIQATVLAEEASEILDNADDSTMPKVQKADKRANYRMLLAKCFDRETFGDKVQQDVNVRGVQITTTCKELQDLLNGA